MYLYDKDGLLGEAAAVQHMKEDTLFESYFDVTVITPGVLHYVVEICYVIKTGAELESEEKELLYLLLGSPRVSSHC